MQVVDRAELLFSEVLNALRQISENSSVNGPLGINTRTSESRNKISELEGMLQKEKAEFEVFLTIKSFMQACVRV